MSPTHAIERCPLLGIEDNLPETVFILPHQPSGRFWCYCHEGTYGIVAFTSAEGIAAFAQFCRVPWAHVVQVPFDTARQIAKERPQPVECVMILDDMANPIIHYVQ